MDERLLKIVELATRGIGGEKINAQRIAERELQKLGITMDEFLHSETRVEQIFKYRNDLKKRLLRQLIYKFAPDAPVYMVKKGGRRVGKYATDLKKSEFVQISFLYGILKRDMKKELETFYYAFYAKNEILGDANPDGPRPTDEEIAENERAERMARGIRKSKIHKQLEKVGE